MRVEGIEELPEGVSGTKVLPLHRHKISKTPQRCFAILVRVEGIEPSASVLSGQRSTTELHARIYFFAAEKLPTIKSGTIFFKVPGAIFIDIS